MKRLILSILAAGAFSAAMAIPALPGLCRFSQPDGSVVELRIVGDEHGHVLLSTDGMLVVNNGGRMEYARFDSSGFPVASGIAVGEPVTSNAVQMLRQSPEQIERWTAMVENERNERIYALSNFNRMKTRADDSTGEGDSPVDEERLVPLNFGRTHSTFPVTGVQKALVILVEYQDVAFEYGDFDYFNRMLNEDGFSDHGSLGSARDWFVYNSNGQFLPDFDVYGPVKLPNKREYYGKNDLFGNDVKPYEMVIDAFEILDEEVDFSQYDRDGDGKIDNVFIFYAGKGEHDSGLSNAVWPHSWNFEIADPDKEYVYDDVILSQYACTCEYPNGYKRADGIGTFIHEFSHVIGLPDLYVTTYSGGFTPGPWSVLDQGPYNNDRLTPPNYSSYEKCALGWIEMQPLAPGTLELPDFPLSNVAYALPTENPNEFFFFENRQLNGNDAFLPGHGMLAWHIDYDEKAWENNVVNNNASHQRVDLVEADNSRTEKTRNGDSFPGVKNVTKFTFASKPSLQSWKKKSLGMDITNIEETEDGLIRLTVVETEDVNAVESIVAPEFDDKIYYDLTGRRILNPANGIYIHNGKKVVVKN